MHVCLHPTLPPASTSYPALPPHPHTTPHQSPMGAPSPAHLSLSCVRYRSLPAKLSHLPTTLPCVPSRPSLSCSSVRSMQGGPTPPCPATTTVTGVGESKVLS